MTTIFPILIILFAVFGFIFAISPLFSLRKEFTRKDRNIIENDIQANLDILGHETNAEQKANAFINLMDMSYISIHIMGNQGGKYDDKKQVELFRRFLTPQAVKKISRLG